MQLKRQENLCASVGERTQFMEDSMKTLKYFCVAMLAVALLAIPTAAQKGKGRSNAGGANRADNRADLVQSSNKKKDKDKDPDNDNNKGKHKGEKKGKHKGHKH